MKTKGKTLASAMALAVVAGAVYTVLTGYRSRPVPRPVSSSFHQPASEYEFSDANLDPDTEAARPALLAYLAGTPPGARVLDLGCGNGSLLATLRDRNWQLTGVDISRSGIEQARNHWAGIRFEVADATGDVSRLGEGRYDALLSTEVLEHIFLPRKYAASCFRLLKPGGTLVLTTPYYGYLKNLAISLFGRWDAHHDPLWDFGHVKFWSVDTLSFLLYEAGFEDLEWRGAGRFPPVWSTMVFRAKKPLPALPGRAAPRETPG